MAYAPLIRSMDDFLITPTTRMDDDYAQLQPSTMGEISIFAPSDLFSEQYSKRTPVPSATLRDLTDEPIFWRDYTSDEEVASPIDNDDLSIQSTITEPEDAALLSDDSILEQVADGRGSVEIHHAKAVRLINPGKPNLIWIPKCTNNSSARKNFSAAPTSTIRLLTSKVSRLSVDGGKGRADTKPSGSSQSPCEKSSESRTSISVPTKSSRRKYHQTKLDLSLIQSDSRSESPVSASSTLKTPKTALLARKADFLKHDPCSSMDATTLTASPSPPKPRLHKFSSSLSLKGFGKGLGQNASSLALTDTLVEPAKESDPIPLAPVPTGTHIPLRTSSRATPKMMPRGASERAPVLVLPPCPDDPDEDQNKRRARRWPARKDSAATTTDIDPSSPSPSTPHRRRRSYSAAIASAKA